MLFSCYIVGVFLLVYFSELYFGLGVHNSLCNDAAASITDCSLKAGLMLDHSAFILESQHYFTVCTIR